MVNTTPTTGTFGTSRCWASSRRPAGHTLRPGALWTSPRTVSWVKHLVKEWVRHIEPDVITARYIIRTAKLASEALLLRAGGHDHTQLRLADMSAVVRSINTATHPRRVL